MAPTLSTAPPPPVATATASTPQPAASTQPTDNKEEFSQTLAGARGQGKAARARGDLTEGRTGSSPGGNALPSLAAPETPASAIPGDGDAREPDGSPTDRDDPLLSWMDTLSLGTAPITVPPVVPAGPAVEGAFQPGNPDAGPSTGVSFAAAIPGDCAPLGAGGSPAALPLPGEAARSPLTAASEELQGGESKAVEGRDSLPFPAGSPAAVGWQGGDAAGTPTSRAADAAAPEKSVDQPVGEASWGRELGSRVLWLAKDNQQYAELHLNPPHLGPLEVRISLQPDQGATISFLSSHAAVRDAVADALPQLRDLFAEGGFTALDVSVSHQSGGGHSLATPHAGTFAADAQESAPATDNEDDGQRRLLHTGRARLVDYFA